MNTFNLTWEEAKGLGVAGSPVRHETATQWVAYIKGLWWLLDRSGNPIEVITASDFGSTDYQGSDWTIDPIGTVRDVCLVEPTPYPKTFLPPSLSLSIGVNTLTALLGVSSPAGSFQLRFLVNGSPVAVVEATQGVTSVPVALPPLALDAQVIATSRLPLPAWSSYATAHQGDPSAPPSFLPTLVYRASYPYDCSNAANFYLPDGVTPAGRVSGLGDNVRLDSNIWNGALTAHMALMSPGITIGNWPPAGVVTCPGGLIVSSGSYFQSTSVVGPLYILAGGQFGGSGVATTATGNVYLSSGAGLAGNVIVNGDVVAIDSVIYYANTINGNLFMLGTSSHDPGGSLNILTINGNLDVYAPAAYPVPYVTVSGVTTYHP